MVNLAYERRSREEERWGQEHDHDDSEWWTIEDGGRRIELEYPSWTWRGGFLEEREARYFDDPDETELKYDEHYSKQSQYDGQFHQS